MFSGNHTRKIETNYKSLRLRIYKFGNGNKLKSLYTATLPCVIAGSEISIITNIVNSDIALLLLKDAMKRAI